MRGRKATPTAIKTVMGNPGKRALNRQEPMPTRAMPEPLSWLDDTARGEWVRVVRDAPAGLLTSLDMMVLAAYCNAYSKYQKASLMCDVEGFTVVSQKGTELQAPWVGTMNTQVAIMLKCCSEMGFTPTARTRIRVQPDDGAQDDNPAREFFN